MSSNNKITNKTEKRPLNLQLPLIVSQFVSLTQNHVKCLTYNLKYD
jgi:hypothetical protein